LLARSTLISHGTNSVTIEPYIPANQQSNVTETHGLLPTVFTRDSIYAIARICYRPSVCLSVCPSVTRVYHRKTVEVRIIKFSPYGSPIPLVFRDQVSSRNSGGFPQSGALNEGGVGRIGDFQTLSRHISETVQDRTKVAINH